MQGQRLSRYYNIESKVCPLKFKMVAMSFGNFIVQKLDGTIGDWIGMYVITRASESTREYCTFRGKDRSSI